MFVHYRTQGIILKKIDRGEADQLLIIYTKDFGKLEVLGKGIRKIKSKLRSGVELFYLTEIEFIQGKTYKTLTDAVLIEKFQNIRKNLIKLRLIYQIVEILDEFIRGEEKDEEIWKLLKEVFYKLNETSLTLIHYSLIYYYFFWNLLSVLGYKAEISDKLINKTKIDSELSKILKIILKKDLSTLLKLKMKSGYLNQLKKISQNYLNYIHQHVS